MADFISSYGKQHDFRPFDRSAVARILEFSSRMAESQKKLSTQDSFIAQVTQLVKQAQQSRSRTQNLSHKAALWLTVIAVSAGIITFISWLPAGDIAFAIERTITVMVIAYPHALGLAGAVGGSHVYFFGGS